MSSYQYRKSYCGDKTVVRSSYLHNGASYTGKIASLYWTNPLGPFHERFSIVIQIRWNFHSALIEAVGNEVIAIQFCIWNDSCFATVLQTFCRHDTIQRSNTKINNTSNLSYVEKSFGKCSPFELKHEWHYAPGYAINLHIFHPFRFSVRSKIVQDKPHKLYMYNNVAFF